MFFLFTLAYVFFLLDRIQHNDCHFVDNNEEESKAQLGKDLAEGLAEDDKIELGDNNVNDLSGKDEINTYTSESCKVTFAKVSKHLSFFHQNKF